MLPSFCYLNLFLSIDENYRRDRKKRAKSDVPITIYVKKLKQISCKPFERLSLQRRVMNEMQSKTEFLNEMRMRTKQEGKVSETHEKAGKSAREDESERST